MVAPDFAFERATAGSPQHAWPGSDDAAVPLRPAALRHPFRKASPALRG